MELLEDDETYQVRFQIFTPNKPIYKLALSSVHIVLVFLKYTFSIVFMKTDLD